MQLTLGYFLRANYVFHLESIRITGSVNQRFNLRCLTTYLLIILLMASYPLTAFAQYETAKIPPTKNNSVLLLRNGQTFTGAIAKSRGVQVNYTLVDAFGNQLRFSEDQVEFVSDSILEIYAYRRAKQIRNNASACLALAQWCMQSRLFDQAQEQIDNAITIDGRSATISRLEVRLNLMRSPPVGQAGQSTGSAASTSIVSAAQVQQRIDRFPDGVVHQFIGSVQSSLLNRCAVAGCHGPNPKSKFVLFRTSVKRAVPHRISLRNLFNTLATLDLVRPESSSLLTAATTVHGTQKQPALGIDATQEIANLVNWVRVVASIPTHNIESNPVKPMKPAGPIMYQQSISQRTNKMATPDSEPLAPSFRPSILPNNFQQWIQSQRPQPTQATFGLGVVLPVEMLAPALGPLEITPTEHVNLTPGIGGKFFLPSDYISQHYR